MHIPELPTASTYDGKLPQNMSVIIEEEIINNYRDGTDIDLSGKTILENSMRG